MPSKRTKKSHYKNNKKNLWSLFDDNIDKNDERPSTLDKEKDIKQLGIWINHQITNYKSKKDIMVNELIHDKWTDFINEDNYKKFFIQS